MSLWPPLPPPVGITPMAVDVLVALPTLTSAWGRTTWGVGTWGGWDFEEPTPMDCDVQGLDIERGRSDALDHISAGGMRITLQDPERKWSPWVIPADGFRRWRTGVPIQARTPAGHLFTGVVTEIHASEKPEEDWQRIVEIVALDPLTFLAITDEAEQNEQGTNELAGARLERIFHHALPPSWVEHDFDPGMARMQSTTLARPALEEMWLTADSDAGVVSCTTDGVVRFWDIERGLTEDRRVVPQVTFTDDDVETVPWGPPERMVTVNATGTDSGATYYTLGNRFTATADGLITHLRYQHPPGPAPTLSLWTVADKVKQVTVVDHLGTPGEWVEVPLPTPYMVTAGTEYQISVTNDGIGYLYGVGPLVSAAPHLGSITSWYVAGTDKFPVTPAGGGRHYLLDVVYQQQLIQPPYPAPMVCTTKFDVTDDQAPVINWIGIAAAGGTQEVVTDSTSIAWYGRRSTHRNDLIHAEGQSWSRHIAETFLSRVNRQSVVITPLVFNALQDLDSWEAAHSLDVVDRVAVHRSAGGDRLDITASIDQIQHQITPYSWSTTITLAPGTQRTAYSRWGVARWGQDSWS